jgi:hypothetical protein
MGTWPGIHCISGYSKRSLQETQERRVEGTHASKIYKRGPLPALQRQMDSFQLLQSEMILKAASEKKHHVFELLVPAVVLDINCDFLLADVQVGGCGDGNMDQ